MKEGGVPMGSPLHPRIAAGILTFAVFLAPVSDRASCQEMSLVEIRDVLRSNPPNSRNDAVREEAILNLDEYLKRDASRTDPQMIWFYEHMVDAVNSDLSSPVTEGARIWSMYNDGFIVKTPSTVFAFDLVDAYSGWSYRIPSSVLYQIQVLFVSHNHGDHYDSDVTNLVRLGGGEVVCPAEDSFGSIRLGPGEQATIAGLSVTAHNGLHSVPVRVYEVTTPEGLTFLHTGDNQTSTTLPSGLRVDVLLLNAWVNESGTTSSIIGMRNCINKILPFLTIPGHIQELSHAAPRPSFESALAADDVPIPGIVSVEAWGERYDYVPSYETSVEDWTVYR